MALSAAVAKAQDKGSISGRLTDAETSESVVGSVIEVYDIKTPESKKYHTTGVGGVIDINSLSYGEYRLVFSYLGYKNLELTVNVNKPSNDVGTLRMETDVTEIGRVEVEVAQMRTSQKGDTIVYNAEAFKVSADADTEGLLAKMPGITITDGEVQAQGETVQKVLVDGREFFGDDVTSAIRNLPAEVVERVEVYDRLSDQAQFTGMDDGEGYKAINIVTAQNKRSGQFGKVYAAYGIPDKYIAGGNVNIFSGTSRLSLIGLVNNLNQQNFSFEDILGVVNPGGRSGGREGGGGMHGFMVRPQPGIATVQAFGVNYSDQWGKKVEFTGSYFFNHTDTENLNSTQRWNYTGTDLIRFDTSESDTWSGNYNHRFNARLDYKINDNHNLMIRPSFSYQSYANTSDGLSSIENLLDGTSTPIQSRQQKTESERDGFNGGMNILYRAKLGKPGRTITVNLDGNASKNDNTGISEQYYYFPAYAPGMAADSTYNQRSVSNSYSYRLSGGATYTEPLSKSSQLSLEYRARYNYSDMDRKVYRWLEDLAPPGFDPQFDDLLSNINNSGYITQNVGPGYRFSNSKANLSANVSYQNAVLENTQSYPREEDNSYSFDNVVYSVTANFNFDQANSLRIRARSGTDNPNISELSDVTDLSNTQYVTAGNPSLKPSYEHRIMTRFTNSDTAKGSTLTVMLGAEAETGYITDRIIMNRPQFVLPNTGAEPILLGEGNQFSSPINMGGRWQLFTGISYGFPIKFLLSNLNLDLGGSFERTPAMINDLEYAMNESYYNGGATLSSNISANLDFTVRYRGGYNISTSMSFKKSGQETIVEELANKYFSHNVTASVKWVFWKGLTFSGNATYTQDKGITDDYNEDYLICNLYIGKKIFRNQLGEISIGVNDLLNQNENFRRTVRTNYIQNSTNRAIGRYFAVQFIYNLRNFGKNASRNSKDYEGLDNRSSSPIGVQRQDGGRFMHR